MAPGLSVMLFVGIRAARRCMPVLIAMLALGLSVPARASVSYVWSAQTRIANSGLTGVACPSASLCVAVDQGGEVLVSPDPVTGTWQRDRGLGADAFAGVACPTTALCLAVDRAGDVVSSDNPTGGASQWTVAHVSGHPLSQVSCPTIGLCAITQSVGTFTSNLQVRDYGNVLVSHSPDVGGSWMTEHADDDNGPECGKYGPFDGCYQSFSGLACPTVSLCVATDTSGGVVWSGGPSATTARWGSNPLVGGPDPLSGIGTIGLPSLACPTSSFCVGLCDPAYAFIDGTCGDSPAAYSAGIAVTWDPTALLLGAPGPITGTALFDKTESAGSGVWCQSSKLCFVEKPDGDLAMSQDPAAGGKGWSVTRRGDVNEPITGISCSREFCVAVDAGGNAISGIPVNRSEVRKALHRICVASAGRRRLSALVRSGGYKMRFAAPSAGRLTITWRTAATSTHGRVAATARPVLLAHASRAFRHAGMRTIKLTLTHAGRLLITRARRLGVRVVAKFVPTGNAAITATGTPELSR